MNSDNVEYWSNIELDETENSSELVSKSKSVMKKSAKKNSNKLSKVEYITVLAAADTAGSFLGAAVASGPAAVAASAAAGLYFDVE